MKTLSQQLPDFYEYYENSNTFYLRQVKYPDDMALLHKWMHEPHVIPQWQLNKSETDLKVYFEKQLADDHHRLFIVGVDGQDVGYAEIYEAKRDRLSRYYIAHELDLGWHLLFGEKSAFGKGYLRTVARLLNFYIFEHANSLKIVGEPDSTVKPYAAVVEEMCYETQGILRMPEKDAMLYYCFRDTFYQKFGEYLVQSQQYLAQKKQYKIQ
ncbi:MULTISPECIES: GNAT family N-acetyltransferase [Acinetobacter]|jgi:RimJ/RimL family protein N-acetyltransferase|uniref:GNAT family N-acetyltransferase n=1 Tax=Acinetobacter TaxID=469 RepID=UPI0004D6BB91|nr:MULTISPECIES: GNAT family N-acetyltransferase [unclassified Acinetobacter]KEC83240.1 siderophore biosynthesis protein [Acinetobacter sp. ETR1]UOH16631.1 acetyltransferase [Acinetobacter sp. NyZ410]WEE41560.1 GNAT family N-acetyltransferase [Acinetobacter sp. TAC-1]